MSDNVVKDSFSKKCMELALEKAELAFGLTPPNPMVGAVIVKDNDIVGVGYHKKAGGPHAEVNALREAGEKAHGATMYVTLEPCCHYGRTPPCTEALIRAKISKVYVAMRDPNPKVSGKGIKILRQHGIEVVVGLLHDRAKRLNEIFCNSFLSEKPFVTLKIAQTLDGRIADPKGDSKWITNLKSRKYVHLVRGMHDAILVGIGTVLKDDPRLTARTTGVRDPYRLILDSNLRIPLNSNLIQNNKDRKTIIVTSHRVDNDKLKKIEDLGIPVWKVRKTSNDTLDLRKVLLKADSYGIKSVLIEGGSAVFSSALKGKLADKLITFVSPKILGAGIPSMSNIGFNTMEEAKDLDNIAIKTFDSDVMIEGYLR